MKKIEIGAGKRVKEGYEHLDFYPGPHIEYVCDVSRDKLPMDDNTYDELIAWAILEHIPFEKVEFVLDEWCRVLKPGGIIKILTDDIDWIMKHSIEKIVYTGLTGKGHTVLDNWKELSHYIYGGDYGEAIFPGPKGNEPMFHHSCFPGKSLWELLEKKGITNIQDLRHILDGNYERFQYIEGIKK